MTADTTARKEAMPSTDDRESLNKRLGRIVDQRIKHLGLTKYAVQKKGGPSWNTLQGVIDGDGIGREHVAINLDKALDWPAGTARKVEAGGDPPPNNQRFLAVLVPDAENLTADEYEEIKARLTEYAARISKEGAHGVRRGEG